MSTARTLILDRLAAALGDPDGTREPYPPVPAVMQPPGAGSDLLDRLTRSFDALGVTWEHAESPVAARLALVSALQAAGVRRMLTWSAQHLPVGGILEALDVLGIAAITPDLRVFPKRQRPQDPSPREDLLASLEPIEIGLTGADCAVAATGTLFLASGPGRPLLVSQLPRRHIVLLPASRVAPTLESWLVTARQASEATSITALTGVSRSRDIELYPAVGIHGPRHRHVVVVQGL